MASVPSVELEELRGPLTRYCYRMLGSAADTDDAVQETMIKAARSDTFDAARGTVSAWVYRIATNVCIDMLRGAKRRALAMDLGPASEDGALGTPLAAERWVEPMPDRRLFAAADPADVLLERETVRLAFVALLQRLPPRQRAVLVLRDVLGFSARDAAEVLDATVASVNSALQRGRAVLEADRPAPGDVFDPGDDAQRELLRRYVTAFESHDVAEMTAVLCDDATTSMPPFAWWLRGGETIAALMTSSDACAGDRLLPTVVNGVPGFGQYRPDARGRPRPFAIIAVEPRGGRVGQIVTFLGSGDRFAEFGLPVDPDR
ncbi:MAG TPA: RNA polymerase subunit sigma-70 [Stackebrandtia sp.]|jgi:RNA polymerase sigma-70 factor (ECF subfamily)|uniref:RNA polymerase subunit sigma-70 n=1 Tax=Stackebrandtia sp. TaxID=2023065 RepID=UPI002D348184|nr:RNA polymerase subunit sigma-70 [Stackebrandtia sp.]HZE39292.1 RNA polymerase subunit sigma-70 [Stackebrandtia sp.]